MALYMVVDGQRWKLAAGSNPQIARDSLYLALEEPKVINVAVVNPDDENERFDLRINGANITTAGVYEVRERAPQIH